jgi:hypothetical protein
MRFSLTSDYRDFFLKHHYIAFNPFLTEEQASDVAREALEVLGKRLRIPAYKLASASAEMLFKEGYDLSRDSALIKNTAHKLMLAEISSELFQTIPLRYGFDQFIAGQTGTASPFESPSSLQQSSCFRPLVGALWITLNPPAAALSEEFNSFPIPVQKGAALFFSAHLSLPWKAIFSQEGLKGLIIVFTAERTQYLVQKKDPHLHEPKKLGYVFGDMLNDSLHPILFRKQ